MDVTLRSPIASDAEEDMRALILGAGVMSSEPLSFLLPTRAVKPMTLMTMGNYQEPKGCCFPSVLY